MESDEYKTRKMALCLDEKNRNKKRRLYQENESREDNEVIFSGKFSQI